MISPVKSAIGPATASSTPGSRRRSTSALACPRCSRRGQGAIKRADRISAWLEAVRLAGFTVAEATRLFRLPPPPASPSPSASAPRPRRGPPIPRG